MFPRITPILICSLAIWLAVSVAVCAQDQQIKSLIDEIQQFKIVLDEQKIELASYRNELTEQNRIKYSLWSIYGVPLIAPLGALIAAIGGWIITFTILSRGFKEQERVRRIDREGQDNQRKEDQQRQDNQRTEDQRHSDGSRIESYLIDSLKYFQGGIQERGLGIAIIETYWTIFPLLQSLWTSVLASQAVYILTKLLKDRELPFHEVSNLSRIHVLLASSHLTLNDKNSLNFAIDALGSTTFSPEEVMTIIGPMRTLVAQAPPTEPGLDSN